MEIDGALFWYLRNFFGDFTHLNCPSLCYNSKLIITDTFLHFSLNKLQPFVVVVTCFENLKRNKVATKVKTFKYRKTIFNSQVVINLHCSGIWVILTNFELVERTIIDVKFSATLNETSPQGFRKECKMLKSQDFLKT